MSESFYRIRCWLHNRRGLSFAVELLEVNGQFHGLRQDETSSSIAAIRACGKIDRTLPFREFSVPAERVYSLLANLNSAFVPAVPPITGGFDGMSYHVQIENAESFSHYSWWLQSPESWEPLNTFWEHVVAFSRV